MQIDEGAAIADGRTEPVTGLAGARETGRACPYCRFPLKDGIQIARCGVCDAVHHADCWNDNAGCAVVACAAGPDHISAQARPIGAAGGGVPTAGTQTSPTVIVEPQIPVLKSLDPVQTLDNAFDNLPVIAGSPLELWLVVVAFAIPGAWIAIDVIKALPDAVRALGAQFFGFRIGLALLLILVLAGLIGAAMLGIAWKLHRRDRVGRGLAYAFAATIIVSVLFSDSRTASETCAMLLSIAAIAILAFTPRVRAVFNAADPAEVPTSVVVCRTLIAVFLFIAILAAVIYFLLATINGKYVVAGVVAAAASLLALRWSTKLSSGNATARRNISLGGVTIAVLLIAVGRSATGLLLPLGLIVSAVACLWLPNDARAFFGDEPLNLRSP